MLTLFLLNKSEVSYRVLTDAAAKLFNNFWYFGIAFEVGTGTSKTPKAVSILATSFFRIPVTKASNSFDDTGVVFNRIFTLWS